MDARTRLVKHCSLRLAMNGFAILCIVNGCIALISTLFPFACRAQLVGVAAMDALYFLASVPWSTNTDISEMDVKIYTRNCQLIVFVVVMMTIFEGIFVHVACVHTNKSWPPVAFACVMQSRTMILGLYFEYVLKNIINE